MPDRIEPPKFTYESDFLFPGVDPIVQVFWFEVGDADGYLWDVKGRYVLTDAGVWITAIGVEPSPQTKGQSAKPLDPEPLRKLLALAPLKDRVIRAEIEFRRETLEAHNAVVADGRKSAVLNRLVREQDKSKSALRPWRSNRPDSVWAEWAEDYIERVEDWGGTYAVLRRITAEKAWGDAAYETNRDRVKRMRQYHWIEGKGAFVRASTRLIAFRESQEEHHGQNF